MFSGLKFISRDQIDEEQFGKEEGTRKYRKKSRSQKGKDRHKKRSSYYSSSDDGLEKMKVSRKKKKWYASDEDLSSSSEESDSEGNCDWDTKKRRSRKREKKMHEDSSQEEGGIRSKNKERSSRKDHRSENDSAYHSEIEQSDRENENGKAAKRNGQKKGKERAGMDNIVEDVMHDDDGGSHSPNRIHIKRKELGLEWMFRPKDDMERKSTTTLDIQPEETPSDEVKKANPKELNPYLKDNGSGYPDDSDVTARGSQLMSSSLVGDGGASWRLKALKRSQEQAAREGRKLEEVVDERWGSVGQLAVTVASARAAPSRAHLHAIKNRKKGFTEEQQPDTYERSSEKDIGQEKLSDVSRRHPKMKVPKLQDSLSWGKQRQKMSTEDTNLISAAISTVNKYANDGSFFDQVMCQQNNDSGTFLSSPYVKCERQANSNLVPLESEKSREEGAVNKPAMSANQLAAKVLQLRMKGKHEEAEKLMKEAETVPVRQATGSESSRLQYESSSRRYIMHDGSAPQKKKEEDADMHLAKKIMRNQQYSLSGRADDEYDYDDDARRKNRKKGGSIDRKSTELTHARRILTLQERCQFCFENPTRPKHIVVAIANFTYLTLPNWEPVVPGHCYILPMQHESATRTVDNNVWDEIRNFKKCLIMMFAKQERDLVFLETVMGLAQQKRHCLIECIPLPREIARQAPVYFKKAIDEAEDEWSQHNAKKLIDTSEKGLRGSIPKDFPYFHVEFGLNKGFVHVIDDERQFESNFGLNVIRGMLHLPAEDIHRHRKHESVETQKKAVANFAQDWESFDWTKQLY